MASLPLLPDLPDAPYRRATTLGSALRGHRRRVLLLLGSPAELAQAVGELGPDAQALWAAHTRAQGVTPGPLSAAIVTGRQAANLFIQVQGTETSPFAALTQAGKLVQSAQAVPVDEVVLWGSDDTAREALWSAWVASRYALPTLRSQAITAKAAHASPQPPVAVPVGLGLSALQKWQAVERGGALARWLTALPGNHLTPALYRKRV